MTTYHKTVEIIKDFLDAHNITYKTFKHEPVRTSEEAANVRPEYSISQGAKALIVTVYPKGSVDQYFAQIVVPGDARFDTKKVRKLLDAKEVRFAKEEDVMTITDGVVPGGVPPFGNLWNLPVYVDESLLKNDEIIFNAGDRRCSIAMKSDDYVRVVKPLVVSVV